jgi:hypothetical protein
MAEWNQIRMGVWRGVAMDSLEFHPGTLALPFYELRAGHPWNGLVAVARFQCRRVLPLWTPHAVHLPIRIAKTRGSKQIEWIDHNSTEPQNEPITANSQPEGKIKWLWTPSWPDRCPDSNSPKPWPPKWIIYCRCFPLFPAIANSPFGCYPVKPMILAFLICSQTSNE